MDDVVAQAARSAAGRLAAELGDQLPGDVEAMLRAREDAPAPDQYVVDPISLAGLIVSVASFAWTVYRDLRAKTDASARDVATREVSNDWACPSACSRSAWCRDRITCRGGS